VGQQGALVSLDMGMPDPDTPAGRVDWPAWFDRVLPQVDVFLPSLDEALLMLDRPQYERLARDARGGNPAAVASVQLIDDLAARLLGMGTRIVVLKLGDQGLYLRTEQGVGQLAAREAWSEMPWHRWQDRQLLAPCFQVPVVGTTGSGDCTIAGFLMALLQGLTPEAALRGAVAVGACNVQSPDATSGIPSWGEAQSRASDWPSRGVQIDLDGWDKDDRTGIYAGPHDTNGD
jgi:sugar/nucleoside kinase (ribokinase family)